MTIHIDYGTNSYMKLLTYTWYNNTHELSMQRLGYCVQFFLTNLPLNPRKITNGFVTKLITSYSSNSFDFSPKYLQKCNGRLFGYGGKNSITWYSLPIILYNSYVITANVFYMVTHMICLTKTSIL